ncbi:MAG TPA: hypothetical protein VNG29_03160 [Candidatus Paceibacterota bacterium]|nr:hypothetical protein [Candidatus Paceibacterota bacterium]
MRLIVWGLVSGLLVSVAVVWWPLSWQYVPGIVLGATVAFYFSKKILAAQKHAIVGFLKLAGFVLFSSFAYAVALIEAEWVLGTNGFATFESYGAPDALPAVLVGCFVGGCIGSFILALGMRAFLFRFDLVRGLFLFSLFSGALGSVIVVGFELFGFLPQFLFPIWHVGVAAVTLYLYRSESESGGSAKPVAAHG